MTPQRLVEGLAVLLLLSSPFTVNSSLQAGAASVLGLLAFMLLRPGIVPVVPLALTYQWLQVSIAVFYANYLRLPLAQVLPVGDSGRATWLGLGALALCTAIVGPLLLRWALVDIGALRTSLRLMHLPTLLLTYGVMFLVTVPLVARFGVASQFSQVIQALEAVRWALFLTLVATGLIQRDARLWMLLALAAELAVGLSGYFAGFAVPLLFALLGFLLVFPLLTRPQRATAFALAAGLVAMALVWNAIKSDYRSEVSDQNRGQVVNVGLGERYTLLGHMASQSLASSLDGAIDRFVRRLAYVEYFGLVLERVPNAFPYAEGEQVKTALRHIFMPRALFPSKAFLPSDSELTAYYTGNSYLRYMPGTSISLGYLAEGYIDFGLPGVALMAVCLALLMLLVAVTFKRCAGDPALFAALSCSTLMATRLFETSLPKLLGGTLSVFVVELALLLGARRQLLKLLRGEEVGIPTKARRGPVP
jgi:hypothetical protein